VLELNESVKSVAAELARLHEASHAIVAAVNLFIFVALHEVMWIRDGEN
jgi:hypothetical protein